MRILLVNVAHPSIGSRIPDDHLPPFGLLCVGGPLLDDGHEVSLFDADRLGVGTEEILARVASFRPDAVLFGHAGSTSAHPIIAEVAAAVRARCPDAWLIYGGVYPTYHHRDILERHPAFDAIVRGEGEVTARELCRELAERGELRGMRVPGVSYAFDDDGVRRVVEGPPREIITRLDDHRVGWELIRFEDYSYWGGLRAVVVQFSRGCPHRCNYCGQRGFWTKWRHRDPVRFARELAWLHRVHGVQVFNFADENPTVDRAAWHTFLEALIAEEIDVTLVGSTRADDIVRDRDLLHLYKKAGWVRFLLGVESTDEATLARIRKGATTRIDREAIRLLREHGILSMATWAVGFEEERDRDLWRGLLQLLSYDPDQVQLLYVTPHRWTPFFELAKDRTVCLTDQRRWDYKHQVLASAHVPPWRLLAWVKLTEAVLQLRPRALARHFSRDPKLSHAMRWYSQMGRRVWPHEIYNFLFRDARRAQGPTVAAFWGKSAEPWDERSMLLPLTRKRKAASALTREPRGPETPEAARTI